MAKSKLFTIETVGEKLVVTYADKSMDELNVNELKDEIQQLALYHGLKQKLGDSAANAKGDLAFAKASIGGVIDALTGGDWNRRGGGTGGTLIIEAIARVKDITEAEAREKWTALSEEDQEAVKKADSIKAAMAAIRAERAAAKAERNDEGLDLL